MSVTKDQFFMYIGDEDSLSGYVRSYKLVLYKILIEDVIYKRKSYVTEVVEKFKQFYIDRKKSGKVADKDVDIKIANIESSTIEQVKNVIMVNPYRYIHENGYLHIWQDERQNEYFVFNTVLMRTITDLEWAELLMKVRKKLNLYFSRIDGEEIQSEPMNTQMQNAAAFGDSEDVIHVDFSDVSRYCNEDYNPAVIVIDNTILKLSNWEELFKVYFYLVERTDEGKAFFRSVCDKTILGFFGRRISKSDIVFSNPCKFAKDMYVECLKTRKPQHLLDTYRYASANLQFIKYVKDVLFINFDLWLCKRNSNPIDEACNALIDTLSPKGRPNNLKKVKTKSFIAHINAEILSDAEKFYLRIEKEYDKKILLGDIIINGDEENILKQYMQSELLSLNNFGTRFKPKRMKIFAFGLVRFAMKYYSEGKFWPFFKDEYGVAVKVNNQGGIHYWFRLIMKQTGKTYDDTLPQKIDNISLHSFVTDKCSHKFFDYLFDFWRIELNRNIENMYGEGTDIFKELIEEIKSNNSVGINNVMKHTSMALELNERSCWLRIRRFLKLMDKCFWKDDVIPETGNRFNELLRNWMDIPNGKFQSELRIKTREKGKRGQKMLSNPQLQVQFAHSVFSLRLPREILPHCTEEEYPVWDIKADGFEPIIVCPELKRGSAFLYTEETETNIPSEMLFKRISVALHSEKHTFKTFPIKADEVRFFKEDGTYIDHSISLPAGNLYCYSKVEEIPQILYKDKQIPQLFDNIFVGVYQAEKGNIVLLPNNHAVQVGEKIYEGLNGESTVSGVKAISGGVTYSVYSKLPKILFKASKAQIGGVAILISGSDKPCRLTDCNYHEFKIDDSLDEIYAYIINLKDFIAKEGCYQIAINLPNSQKQHVYNLCYIKDFTFKYLDAPYIFKDTGSICFDKKFNIVMQGDAWEQTESINQLNLNFNPESAEFSKEYIEDWKIKLFCILADEAVQFKFDIPIFLWKYRKEAEWAINKPADIFLKNLPNKLYVKGPFSFNDKSKNKLFLDLKNADSEDTDMFAESVKDEDFFVFSFGNFKSWLNQDIVRRQIKLQLDGKDYSFVDVYCRSVVLSHDLMGDFETGKLYGTFDVFGDGEYTISIKKDNQVIAEDLPLIDGKFELEKDISFGIYSIKVYELFEDDSGFESFNVEIGSYNVEIKDLRDLTKKTMFLKGIKDINGKYAPIQLDYEYRIENLTKTSFSTLRQKGIELLGLWREELSDEQLLELPIYKCDISNNQGDKFQGLLIFYSRVDIKTAVLLELTRDSAVSLYYDSYRYRLIPEAQVEKFQKYERFKRTTVLQDDLYSFVIE